MFSVIPARYPVVHVRRVLTDQKDPDTGNNLIAEEPPRVRYAQDITQIGRMRGSSHQVITAEFVKRVETSLHIAVADPDQYGPLDKVLLFPEFDEVGDYIEGTGFAFWVDGVPIDGRQSPWPLLTKAFGGLVRIRRVT